MEATPGTAKLTVIVPCYNEEKTLAACVRRVLAIAGTSLRVEIVVVDDCSRDGSLGVAKGLVRAHPEVRVLAHERNRGKGAALRTGFAAATGDFVAVQDADLEYDPRDLVRLLEPLLAGDADVVLGSRFTGSGPHRVLYFWHYLGNTFLTLLSNMFTDLNLTDMETCYKVFRREIIQGIEIEEDRFGFEPEVVAKIAHRGLRIYEMGVSYHGRTYEEGKKIGLRDAFRALYCIVRYNGHRAPLPMQFLLYLFVGGVAAASNLAFFLGLLRAGVGVSAGAATAFVLAAAVNYGLCVLLLFRHKARWSSPAELLVYSLVVAAGGALDVGITRALFLGGFAAWAAKAWATAAGLVFNFLGRRFWVFPERRTRSPLSARRSSNGI